MKVLDKRVRCVREFHVDDATFRVNRVYTVQLEVQAATGSFSYVEQSKGVVLSEQQLATYFVGV